ncbi:MAG: IS5 family transposase (plasmid) [Candidatus Algichlamydia australiensis]|nr:IS5 family transposase [Chlamydiales bacterium]
MKPKTLNFEEGRLFEHRLSDQLNPKNPLFKMSKAVPWEDLEKALSPYFPSKVGAPAKPIRLISGLFMLQHCFDVSDEDTLQNWLENPYWQFFCGYDYLQWELPINPSSMSRWRKRIGVEGAEAILRATVRAAEITGIVKPVSFKRVIADTTVMEKNVTYPRDVNLYLKSLQVMVRIAKKRGIRLRQTYTRTGRKHAQLYSRYAHARQMKRAHRELKKLRTITGRVLREMQKWTEDKNEPHLCNLLNRIEKILLQKRKDKNKIYSLHEEVECIAKGKAHKKYEFGCKVSIVVTHKEGVVVSSQACHGNPYDGHTLKKALENTESITGHEVEMAFLDRGYKGHKVEGIKVWISGMRRGLTAWYKKQLARRQAIEPRIGHMKSDGKLKRNYLKGILGDELNAILCGAGENCRIILRGIT